MATRKKKSDVMDSINESMKAIQKVTTPKNVPSGGWPKINQGSHLTVKTFEDGRTELIWDDVALLNDVRNAIMNYDSVTPAMKPSVVAKVAVQKKKAKAKSS